MKIFNAFQATVAFAAAPFIIEWLHRADFTGSAAAFWLGVVAYVIGFVSITGCVVRTMGED